MLKFTCLQEQDKIVILSLSDEKGAVK